MHDFKERVHINFIKNYNDSIIKYDLTQAEIIDDEKTEVKVLEYTG